MFQNRSIYLLDKTGQSFPGKIVGLLGGTYLRVRMRRSTDFEVVRHLDERAIVLNHEGQGAYKLIDGNDITNIMITNDKIEICTHPQNEWRFEDVQLSSMGVRVQKDGYWQDVEVKVGTGRGDVVPYTRRGDATFELPGVEMSKLSVREIRQRRKQERSERDGRQLERRREEVVGEVRKNEDVKIKNVEPKEQRTRGRERNTEGGTKVALDVVQRTVRCYDFESDESESEVTKEHLGPEYLNYCEDWYQSKPEVFQNYALSFPEVKLVVDEVLTIKKRRAPVEEMPLYTQTQDKTFLCTGKGEANTFTVAKLGQRSVVLPSME